MLWKIIRGGWLLGLLAGLLPLLAPAQATSPVPARPLRSLSPADTTLAELDFLRSEIGGARVVFLGEPTHGEGNVLAAKIRLVAFLQQRMGFTTLAMESGFFELHKAQREIAIGKSVSKNLQSSIFPIWMQTQEFQAVVPLVGQDGLRVMGFDPQLSGDYSADLVDDLQDFLDDEKGGEAINYDRLDSLVSYMAEHYALPPGRQPAALATELAKAEPLLRHAATAPTAARRAEAEFWQQCVRSLGVLAHYYAAQKPDSERRAADSNPRDAQMADNLLWYLRQHPAEKIICWGALPHFANRVEVLDNEELRAYRPMGRVVKEALGASQVYTLGTLAGGGTHGAPTTAGTPVPTPAPGTLEASLLARNTPYAFVSLKHDAPGRQLVTYAIDYQPLAGPWSEVVDGFLFLPSVAPAHLTAADSAANAVDTAAVVLRRPVPGSLSPAPGQGAPTIRPVTRGPDVSGVRTVRGVVLDQRSRAALPYATVLLPGQQRGTLADANGRFALALPGPTMLKVSSLGYGAATVQSPRGNEELTVLLVPAAYTLAELRQPPPPDPASILTSVIKNLPANYDPQAYTTEVYTHQRRSSFDTLRYEAETVGRLHLPASRERAKMGTAGYDDNALLQPEQQHVLTQHGKPERPPNAPGSSRGFAASTADPVQNSPLFQARNGRNYTLKLDSIRQQGADTLYVLSFVALRPDRRSTGLDQLSAYQGRLLVRRRDYALLHYEAVSQVDTAAANAATRKAYARAAPASRALMQLVVAERATQVADYSKAANGRYYLSRSVSEQVSTGHTLTRKAFYNQRFSEFYFRLVPVAGAAPVVPAKAVVSAAEVPYRPEFWSSYPRPGGELAAPAARP